MEKSSDRQSGLAKAGGAIFLIGLGVMFLLEVDIWPWIMLLIGATGFIGSYASGAGLGTALQGLIWPVGIFVMDITGWQWPLILIAIGIGILVGAIVKPEVLGKSKPKRGHPPADDEENY